MATETINLKLSKAEETDEILDTLEANNNNFEIIDNKYQELEENKTDKEYVDNAIERIPIVSATETPEGAEITITDADGTVVTTIKNGTGVNILGSYNSIQELETAHPTGNVGDAYLIEGALYVWSQTDSEWTNVGNIKGPKGDTGDAGADGEDGLTPHVGENGNWWLGDMDTGMRGITVLEASTDNVIDFNTLTEAGAYLIKNVLDTTATNAPSAGTSPRDFILVVEKVTNTSSGTISIFQYAFAAGATYRRNRNNSAGTWTDWAYKFVPTFIDAGTLGAELKANGTAVATLTTAQIRNIKASTTDLTAGTSSLSTGNIYLVYE